MLERSKSFKNLNLLLWNSIKFSDDKLQIWTWFNWIVDHQRLRCIVLVITYWLTNSSLYFLSLWRVMPILSLKIWRWIDRFYLNFHILILADNIVSFFRFLKMFMFLLKLMMVILLVKRTCMSSLKYLYFIIRFIFLVLIIFFFFIICEYLYFSFYFCEEILVSWSFKYALFLLCAWMILYCFYFYFSILTFKPFLCCCS